MDLTQRNLTGLTYLETVTDLLHRIRHEGAFAGLYEAADLHWWWREDDAADPERQQFWFDAENRPVACLLCFDAETVRHYDFFCLPSARQVIDGSILPLVVSRISRPGKVSMMNVRDDDRVLQRMLEEAGFVQTGAALVQTELVEDPPKTTLPPGFRLTSRVEDARLPHHLIRRNGPDVDRKLREGSLYRPDLDLCVRDEAGTVAAYVLFWMDPVTQVGLIEPVRTEEAYQRKGLARHVIAEGVARLRALGAESIRVSYTADNDAAANLYHGLGFVDRFKRLEYRREPSQSG